MVRSLPRRQVLAALLAVPSMAALLAACSDSGEEAKAEDAEARRSGDACRAGRSGQARRRRRSPTAPSTWPSCSNPACCRNRSIGKADAKVTIVEYASMTCPHCAHFHATTLPELKTKYIDTGKVRLIFREFPFDPRAEAGFMLARCSGDNYFPMVDVLFKQQMQWAGVENAKEALLQIAKLAGFTQEKFEACLTDQKLLEDVRAVRERGDEGFRRQLDADLLHQWRPISWSDVDCGILGDHRPAALTRRPAGASPLSLARA